MFREEVILHQAIQHLPASTDRILTEVLKAILYRQAAVLKDPVRLHITTLLRAAAGHTAAAGNREVLILQDHHQEEAVLPQVEVAVLHPVVAVADHHPAGVSLKQ
jgi:hypothetical protein